MAPWIYAFIWFSIPCKWAAALFDIIALVLSRSAFRRKHSTAVGVFAVPIAVRTRRSLVAAARHSENAP